jgi:hypothetical protein
LEGDLDSSSKEEIFMKDRVLIKRREICPDWEEFPEYIKEMEDLFSCLIAEIVDKTSTGNLKLSDQWCSWKPSWVIKLKMRSV